MSPVRLTFSFLVGVVLFAFTVRGEDLEEALTTFQVRRLVTTYGAVGDGEHDDTAAFTAALTAQKATTYRPGPWNNSQYNCQTTKPSVVYVPPGTYVISATLPLTYYTQLVGVLDSLGARPTLRFVINASTTSGGAYTCMDAGIDEGPGNGWYGGINQDNFYHQVRNLVVDLTQTSVATAAGACDGCTALHWQVSQATNIVNTDFVLCPTCRGIDMEDGSGGYFGDVAIYGGHTALALGNQQFTLRNVSLNAPVHTGLLLHWGWAWTLFDVRVHNAGHTAIHVGGGVSALSLVDCAITYTVVGSAAYGVVVDTADVQLLLDNTYLAQSSQEFMPLTISGTLAADVGPFWFMGNISVRGGGVNAMPSAVPQRLEGPFVPRVRCPGLLDASRPAPAPGGSQPYFGRSRPAYAPPDVITANLPNGTDVTAALQGALLVAANTGKALYVPYGVYFLSSTVTVPVGTRWFGDAWTRLTIAANFTGGSTRPAPGAAPVPMLRVGQPGDQGTVHMADFMITNQGPAPGAVLLEWNVNSDPAKGQISGVWDVHFRIGGADGTEMNPSTCPQSATRRTHPQCEGVFALIHLGSSSGGVYIENMWGWVADHDIDADNDPTNVNIYSERGLVSHAAGPVWLYGTAMEHSILFQYHFASNSSATCTMGGVLQTESPYYQAEFALRGSMPSWDPPFTLVNPQPQYHAYSIAIRAAELDSTIGLGNHDRHMTVSPSHPTVTLYGTGSYSFFERWQLCGQTVDAPCQRALVVVYGGDNATWASASHPALHLVSTHGSVSVAVLATGGARGRPGRPPLDATIELLATNWTNGFCQTATIGLQTLP